MRGQISEPHSTDMAQGHIHLQGWPLVWKGPETDPKELLWCCFVCRQAVTEPLPLHGWKSSKFSMY